MRCSRPARHVVAVAGGGKSGDRMVREQRLRRAVARHGDSWSRGSVGDGPGPSLRLAGGLYSAGRRTGEDEGERVKRKFRPRLTPISLPKFELCSKNFEYKSCSKF